MPENDLPPAHRAARAWFAVALMAACTAVLAHNGAPWWTGAIATLTALSYVPRGR